MPEFEGGGSAVSRRGPEVAADLMGATPVQLFQHHVLVKEPGTSEPTHGT